MVLAQPLPGAGLDSERIQRARVGDSDALQELITSHRTLVEQVARRFVSDHDDIEDIAQETWIRAAQALGSLRDEARFRPWLRAITRNACLTFLSRRQPSDSLDAEDAPEPADRAADGPEASAEQRDERRRVWEALGALPELDRRALYLREVESLPFEEVARRLGVRKTAAEVRVHRARARFRHLYEATDATRPPCGMAGIRLALLLDGELHGEPAEAVEQHLTACMTCTQRMRTMAQGRSLYRRMGMFALPGLTGLMERLQRVADTVMRWIPVDAAPVLVGNSRAPAAAVAGMTTAVVTAVVLAMPSLTNAGPLDFAVTHTPPPPAAVIAAAPPPDTTLPAFVVSASAITPVVVNTPAPTANSVRTSVPPVEVPGEEPPAGTASDAGGPASIPSAPATSGTTSATSATTDISSSDGKSDDGGKGGGKGGSNAKSDDGDKGGGGGKGKH